MGRHPTFRQLSSATSTLATATTNFPPRRSIRRHACTSRIRHAFLCAIASTRLSLMSAQKRRRPCQNTCPTKSRLKATIRIQVRLSWAPAVHPQQQPLMLGHPIVGRRKDLKTRPLALMRGGRNATSAARITRIRASVALERTQRGLSLYARSSKQNR